MIKNERQLHITKTLLEKLEQDLANVKQSNERPSMRKLQESALIGQIEDLRSQIREYEEIWGSNKHIPELNSFEDLPNALVRARLSLGLTQKELAERLGLPEQQIQRYESNDYQTASVSRIREVIGALGIKISPEVHIPTQTVTLGDFVKRLQGAGFEREFIVKRLLPPSIAHIRDYDSPLGEPGLQVAQQLERIFGWTPQQIFTDEPLELNPTSLKGVKFKLRGRFQNSQLAAHALYAQYVAMLIIQSTRHLASKPLPRNPFSVRRKILNQFGSLNLETALRFVWALGVPIISMVDSSTFQGAAFFKEKGRIAIIMRSKTASPDRWLFDLFHEYWHAATHQADPTIETLQFEEIQADGSMPAGSHEEEELGGMFASTVLLGQNSDKLFHECMKLADNDLWKLKQAVIEVSKTRGVSVSALANSVAFRVEEEGENWWGTAESLQEHRSDIQQTSRDVLLECVDLSQLSGPDLDLLRRSLGYTEVIS